MNNFASTQVITFSQQINNFNTIKAAMPFSERGNSQTKDFYRHKKPSFQTRLKSRGGNRSAMNEISLDNSNDRKPEQRKTMTSFYSEKQCRLNDDFNQTSGKLQSINFNHHDPNSCVCSECSCGRHLCQFHAIKPDLTKNTIYQKDFWKKNPVQNKINISKEYDRYTGPNLEINSTYLKDFDGKQSQISRPKPEDLLKTGGPCNQLTSYSSGFPGYRCDNQYVKPTDKHTRGYFPLRSRSTYTNHFLGNQRRKDEHERIPDNLKTGTNWFGTTTYGNYFKPPNPQDYAKKYKIVEKLEQNPDFNHQYETIYKNNYLGQQSGVCPAKVILETKSKGFFVNSKAKFSENMDFKALDPAYHAISTSKHFYV